MSKHSVVDAKPSTPAEKLITQNLRQYCDDVAPLEVSIKSMLCHSTRAFILPFFGKCSHCDNNIQTFNLFLRAAKLR